MQRVSRWQRRSIQWVLRPLRILQKAKIPNKVASVLRALVAALVPHPFSAQRNAAHGTAQHRAAQLRM